MQTTPNAKTNELTPGAACAAADQLISWLPPGPVAVLGNDTASLTRALVLRGVRPTVEPVVHAGDTLSAAVIVVEHRATGVEEAASNVSKLIAELGCPVCLVISGGEASLSSRAFWEQAMISLDWRKHPLNEVLAPYGQLDHNAGLQLIGFEKVPLDARQAYPLQALVDERDLHTDMTRESGRRSDAHMTRYAQAARFVRQGDRVIDVACGLGYGSYQVAHNCGAASFIGLDASEYAVTYAQINFAAVSPVPMKFVLGDAQHLREMADESADFAVSVETLEHLPEPDLLLSELHRVLTSGGRVYASVPNDWSDETGEDPNPHHFHVYDWKILKAQFQRNGFEIERAWLQDAGGGQKRHTASRSLLEIDVRQGPTCDGEWLLVLARKKGGDGSLTLIERLRESLRLGGGQAASDLFEEVAALDDSLKLATAHALQAWHLSASGDVAASNAWELARDAARQALDEPAQQGHAAEIMALASHALVASASGLPSAGLLGRLRAAHASVVTRLLEGGEMVDSTDRSIVFGAGEGDESVTLGGRDLRALLEGKNWLDQKYGEHMQRIAELEKYSGELERARRWLDEQYHSLVADVSRLGGSVAQ